MATIVALLPFALVGAVFLYSFFNWRMAILGLLVYIPFAALASYLVPHSVAVLAKDALFVIPAYLAFVLFGGKSATLVKPSAFFMAAVTALVFLSIVHMANPNIHSVAVGFVGLKIWLFYVPLVLLVGAFLRNQDDLRLLLRAIVVVAPIPCLIGIAQWLASTFLGYQYVMISLYGEQAVLNNPGFSAFQYGSDFAVYRLASTFSFATQYFGYAFSMIIVSWIASKVETSRQWALYARISFYIAVTATLLSGSRQAFIFVPAALAMLMALDRQANPLFVALVALVAMLALPFIGSLGPLENIATHTAGLLSHYSETVFVAGIVDAFEKFPWGLGTGMNTGAARYVINDPNWEAFESYYAKAAYEFGIAGPFVVVGVFAALVVEGLRLLVSDRSPEIKSVAAGLTVFYVALAANSLKGWMVDQDPVNVYFWLFAGVMFRLATLDGGTAADDLRPQHAVTTNEDAAELTAWERETG